MSLTRRTTLLPSQRTMKSMSRSCQCIAGLPCQTMRLTNLKRAISNSKAMREKRTLKMPSTIPSQTVRSRFSVPISSHLALQPTRTSPRRTQRTFPVIRATAARTKSRPLARSSRGNNFWQRHVIKVGQCRIFRHYLLVSQCVPLSCPPREFAVVRPPGGEDQVALGRTQDLQGRQGAQVPGEEGGQAPQPAVNSGGDQEAATRIVVFARNDRPRRRLHDDFYRPSNSPPSADVPSPTTSPSSSSPVDPSPRHSAFPASVVHGRLRSATRRRVAPAAAVYVSATLHYLTSEVFDLSVARVREQGREQVGLADVRMVLRGDRELQDLTRGVIIPYEPL